MSKTQVRGNVQIQNTTISNDQIVDSTIVLGKLAEGTELIKRDGSVAFTGHLDLSSHKISNLAAPVSSMDAATKQYVDDATSGMVVTREVPTGDVNGSNMEFVLANTPNVGTEQVFVNGTLQQSGSGKDYLISGDTITFSYSPQSGDIILVNYIVDGVVISADVQGSLNSLDTRVGALETSPAASALNDLTDVTISSASNGQVLQYNGSGWVNGAAPSSFSGSYTDLTNKPSLATVATSGSYADLTNTPSLATVATSGSYADLTNKPTLGDVVTNSFGTTITVTSGAASFAASQDTVYLGTLSASVTTWAFTSVPVTNGKIVTITMIIAGAVARTYGDACTINGTSVGGGVKWSGGVPPYSTANTDILTFVIVRDNSGVTNVFGFSAPQFS